VIRKPFEIAELGNIIRLCVTGFDEEVANHLTDPRDSTIRNVATTLRYTGLLPPGTANNN